MTKTIYAWFKVNEGNHQEKLGKNHLSLRECVRWGKLEPHQYAISYNTKYLILNSNDGGKTWEQIDSELWKCNINDVHNDPNKYLELITEDVQCVHIIYRPRVDEFIHTREEFMALVSDKLQSKQS